jgi:soluble lytic murein transglycosylase
MRSATVAGAGILALGEVRKAAPVGRRGATARRRGLGIAIVFAVGAASAGASLGLLASPNPEHQRQVEALTWTASAALQTAQRFEKRAASAEKALAAARARIAALSDSGAAQEVADYQEAERIGVGRFMKDSTALWGNERHRVMAAIVREARHNGLDPLMVAAVIHVESRFDPYAVSGVGACGLMQLMPPTAQWLMPRATENKLRRAHLFNPLLNIELGTAYLAQLLNRFDGDVSLALIAYNAGPGVARSLTPNSKAAKKLAVYPKAVLAAYKTLLAGPPAVAAR